MAAATRGIRANRKPRRLRIRRPIAFLDLETTGLLRDVDHIVEIGILKVLPDGRTKVFHRLINPEMSIPREAAQYHGVTNRRVRGKPSFRQIAPRLVRFLKNCDLAGFNIRDFDLSVIEREFQRAGTPFSTQNRHIIDVQSIFHRKEPRDLTAAYRFYCGRQHTHAHSALADAKVCWEILQAQVQRYPDLPVTAAKLAHFFASSSTRHLDSGRWFEPRDGSPVFARGKHQGCPLEEVAREEPDYLDWLLNLPGLPMDTKRLAQRAKARGRKDVSR